MHTPEPQSDPLFRLITAVQDLSLARSLDQVMEIVRHAARELTGADGATFVLRDGPNCFYADEDAISPLWKGKRFPLEACISGWAMLHRQSVAIVDIYADARIPADAYRPTFVKSLAMVPIRTAEPIGAIGNYWATPHAPTPLEMQLLQALADSTSIAMENVQVYAELEQRVRDRTAELEVANRELEAFAYSVSHDLRAPVRHLDGFASLLAQCGPHDPRATGYVQKIRDASQRLGELIDDLLNLSRITARQIRRGPTNLSILASDITARLAATEPSRHAQFAITPDIVANGDAGLLRIVLENLLGNAWKYTAKVPTATIAFGVTTKEPREFYVQDNGAGFAMEQTGRLFEPFQRLHSEAEFSGHGVGLATVRRIVHKHGGTIRAESAPDAGATFYFTIG